MQILITTQGNLHCLYSDDLELGLVGKLQITRGSHVEPTPDGCWTADMSPVHGPVLGPFRTRVEALAAEVQWLEVNWLPTVH